MRRGFLTGWAFFAILTGQLAAQPSTLQVRVDRPGVKVSPTLYGIFFEEINRAGEGGLYAEMVLNRSFEDMSVPAGWTLLTSEGAKGTMVLDRSRPLNAQNPTCLRLQMSEVPAGGRVGIVNQGFKGMRGRPRDDSPQRQREFLRAFDAAAKKAANGLAVEKGKEYRFSLQARAVSGESGPLIASLETQSGQILAQHAFPTLGREWTKSSCVFTPSATDPDARLVIAGTKPGTIDLDMVSLFPKETFKNRENGLRKDLAQMIADMKPAFVRFPGGCYVEGDTLTNAFRWKKTIGDLAERPGHWNLWGYYSSDGLGFHEYLQFCEDLGAEPLFVFNCGMSHVEQRADDRGQKVELPDLDDYVRDVLDAIEYATGPVTSRYGALRAQAGHPEPFRMNYLEVGNENGGPLYNQRYALFYDAIKAKYPNIKLIANVWHGIPNSRRIEIVDEHYYNNPEFFQARAGMYDAYDRQRYQVYVGEYAVTRECGMGNLAAALGEAAYMTGMERNGDVVVMASYAPLLVHPVWRGWNPNAIVFDAARAYGTPSYHVQALFGNHRADTILPLKLESPPAVVKAKPGMIGVGTWGTQAEFKEIRVVDRSGRELFASDFSKDLKGWKTYDGEWKVRDGALCQTGSGEGVRALAGDPSWRDYTLTLKARKLGGREGFLILFQTANNRDKQWWNLGGWGNSKHALECGGISDEGVRGRIETNRWYDIKIELHGGSVKCYLDGQLIHDAQRGTRKSLHGVAGLSADRREVILKVVNVTGEARATELQLDGVAGLESVGQAYVLAGGSDEDENSFAEPRKIAIREEKIQGVAPRFPHTFPAYSVSVLRLRVKP